MPALSAAQRRRRWLRLLGMPGCLLAALPLALVAAAGRQAWSTHAWARFAAALLGLRVVRRGRLPPPGCLVVANHVGYLDIVSLGCSVPGRFVAMTEIANWVVLGRIARWGGSVFVDRESARSSRALLDQVGTVLECGQRVLLFPEGRVSPDGRTVRPFRPMMFEACRLSGRPLVPVALCYREPDTPAVWAWIGEPSLWQHLWTRVLPRHHITVEVLVGEPIVPDAGADRKQLAETARQAVERLLSTRRVPG